MPREVIRALFGRQVPGNNTFSCFLCFKSIKIGKNCVVITRKLEGRRGGRSGAHGVNQCASLLPTRSCLTFPPWLSLSPISILFTFFLLLWDQFYNCLSQISSHFFRKSKKHRKSKVFMLLRFFFTHGLLINL
jgi:hypothetical protein